MLKIYYGPYSAHGVIKHRPPKLYGIIHKLIELGYHLQVIPTNRLNVIFIHYKDKEIFRCDIRFLKFNISFEDDTVAQNLVNCVQATIEWFSKAEDNQAFKALPELCSSNEANLEDVSKKELQSPISLSFNDKIEYMSYKLFNFDQNTNEKKQASIKNNGYTVTISYVNKPDSPTISGGGLDGKYIFHSIYFHWPAEHIIQGHQYPLEGHLVYYAEHFRSFESAILFKTGILVITVFYQIAPVDNPAFKFVSEIPSISDKIDETVVLPERFVLKSFFPEDTHSYFRYEGSLTVPSYNETILWNIFTKPGYISEQQLKLLTTIYDKNHDIVLKNNRKLQERNARIIYLAF